MSTVSFVFHQGHQTCLLNSNFLRRLLWSVTVPDRSRTRLVQVFCGISMSCCYEWDPLPHAGFQQGVADTWVCFLVGVLGPGARTLPKPARGSPALAGLQVETGLCSASPDGVLPRGDRGHIYLWTAALGTLVNI